MVVSFAGCAGVAPFPDVDLSQPGWGIRQGQAVWQPGPGRPEIAGELLVATRAHSGQSLVQFSKPPFPVVTAQLLPGGRQPTAWEAAFPARDRRFSGRGSPPRRLLWLYLPAALAGAELPVGMTWESSAAGWRLTDSRTKASIAGFFFDPGPDYLGTP